jgi:hypothetical protein
MYLVKLENPTCLVGEIIKMMFKSLVRTDMDMADHWRTDTYLGIHHFFASTKNGDSTWINQPSYFMIYKSFGCQIYGGFNHKNATFMV